MVPKRWLWALAGATLLLYAVVVVLGIALYVVSHRTDNKLQAQIRRNEKATIALCLQRGNLDTRIASDARTLERSRKFLRDHPRGIPGVPVALIQQGIDDDALTLHRSRVFRHNLSILDC